MVIPTIGRSRLRRAVCSALTQDGVATTVVVVADLPAASLASLGLDDLDDVDATAPTRRAGGGRIQLLVTGGSRGPGYARQLGTEAVEAPWVAYLDDDDHWVPHKLRVQLGAAAGRRGPVIVGCQMASSWHGRQVAVPRSVYRGGGLAPYLFDRRRIGIDRNFFATPSLLCPTETARRIGWDATLPRHQDWDFLLRAEDDGVELHQVAEALVVADADSDRKVTSSADWQTSLGWARRWEGRWPERTYVDFLVAQPLRYALQARSWSGVRQVIGAARGHGRPSVRSTIVGLGGLVPRAWWVAALHRLASRSGGQQ